MKNLFKKSSSGFTLIELLVVIAIIAILSTIVLASLGQARNRANDARAASEISSMRAQAELYYNSHSLSYGTATTSCAAGTTLFGETTANNGLQPLVADVIAKTTSQACTVPTGGQAWAFSALLKSGKHFCADSTGFSGERVTAGVLATGTCPTT